MEDSPGANNATITTKFDSHRGKSFTQMSAMMDRQIPPADVKTMFQRTVRVPGNNHLFLNT